MAQSKETTSSWKIISLLIFLAFIIRVLVAPLNRIGDIAVHQEWSQTLYRIGLIGSYFYPIWTYTPPTQPPVMTFLFWLSEHFYQNRFYLAQIHNLTHLPPSSFILWFDQHGEFVLLKLWAIIGDILSSLLAYYLVFKISRHKFLSLIALSLVLFNPLTIYESAHWGQNDIIGTVFIYLALITLNQPPLALLTLPLLFLGISLKPTVLMVLPLFLFFYLKNFSLKDTFSHLLGLILALSLTIFTFIPFTRPQDPLLPQIHNIITHRITTSSKGTIRASNSAFNFYALFFTLDRTPGNQPFLFTNLNNLGYLFIFIILGLTGFIIFKSPAGYPSQLLSLFIFCQGYFLFSTGMLERYFFPAFLASIIIMITQPKFRYLMALQNILWLLNLIYARALNQFLIRSLSLISLGNFLMVCWLFYRHQFKFYRSVR